jgi:uncharacterized protein (TIGR03545 family)
MTNSTTPKKPQGPLRTKALGAIALVIILSVIFSKFFLDHTIKKSIEWSASYVHEAEVNLKAVNTKLFAGELHLHGLQVTDKKKLTHNLVTIEHIRFDLLIDALLRAKIVIEDASIEGLSFNQERSHPGKRYQPTKEQKEQNNEQKKALKQTGQKVAGVAAEELEENVLGNLASIAAGDKAKNQVSEIREELASEKKIKELELVLEKKEKQWQDKIKSFKHQDELKKLSQDIKNVKYDKKKPWKAIKQYAKLSKQVKGKIKEYKSDAKNLKSDINFFEKSIKEVKQLAKKDLKQLGNRFSIKGINSKDLGSVIFMKLLQDSAGEYYKYILLARDYLPNKKNKQDADSSAPIVARKRGDGRTYHYPTTTSYPFFWWQKGNFSVKDEQADIKGTLRDFSSAPQYLKKIATLKLHGSLPKEKVKAFTLNSSFDHRSEVNDDQIKLSIQGYPVTKRRLLKNKKLSFSLEKAVSNWNAQTRMRGQQLTFDIRGLFQDAKYGVSSSSSSLEEIFSKAVGGIPKMSFQAKAQGTWEDLDWKIKSDFADKLTKQLKIQFNAKVQATKDKYKAKLESKLGTAKLEKKYGKLKSQMDSILNSEKGKIESLAKNALKGASKKNKPDTKKLENKAKELFKKFKF